MPSRRENGQDSTKRQNIERQPSQLEPEVDFLGSRILRLGTRQALQGSPGMQALTLVLYSIPYLSV